MTDSSELYRPNDCEQDRFLFALYFLPNYILTGQGFAKKQIDELASRNWVLTFPIDTVIDRKGLFIF